MKNKGFSLVEVVVAMAVLVVVGALLAKTLRETVRTKVRVEHRSLAQRICLQTLESIRSNIDPFYGSGSNFYAKLFDLFERYDTKEAALDVTDVRGPQGNICYTRRIDVRAVESDPNARSIRVFVYLKATGEELAQMATVERAEGSYSVPGEYITGEAPETYGPSLPILGHIRIPTSPLLSYSSQSSNIGPVRVGLGSGYMGFGRDRYYRAFKTDQGDVSQAVYLGFQKMGMDYPFRYGLTWLQGGYSRPASSDEFNHNARLPEETLISAQSYTSGIGKPTLRERLEKMANNDSTYNKKIIRLNSGILPCPPMRNFSDAAKDPTGAYGGLAGQRVVTHPENLAYANNSAIKLRVYTYAMNPNSHPEAENIPNVTVLIKHNLATTDVSVRKMVGNSTTDYAWANAVLNTDYTATVVSSELKIVLKNSPVRCAFRAASNRGLPPAKRLCGLEYIPAPVGIAASPNSFAEGQKDLRTASNSLSKNTARWVITIAANKVSNKELWVETRFGDQTTTSDWNQPHTLSRTFAWVGNTVPYTERHQYVGDPRHMPYADVKAYQGYNRYFVNVPAGDFEGYAANTFNGWASSAHFPDPNTPNPGVTNVDVPRYMWLWREALLNSNSVLGVFPAGNTGYFITHIGLGNEFVGDPWVDYKVKETPWVPSSTNLVKVSEATTPMNRPGEPSFAQAYSRVIAKTDNSWVAIPWLGELYPDSEFALWLSKGNLPGGPGNYYREKWSVFASTFGLPAGVDYVKQVAGDADALFFNGNASGSGNNYFRTESYFCPSCPVATLAGGPIALTSNILPFMKNLRLAVKGQGLGTYDINYSSSHIPQGYLSSEYSGARTRLASEPWVVNQSSNPVIGLIAWEDPANPNRKAWVVMNRLYGVNSLSYDWTYYNLESNKLANNLMFVGALKAGEPGVNPAIRVLLPNRIELTSPLRTVYKNPSTIPITWNYTAAFPNGVPYSTAYSTAAIVPFHVQASYVKMDYSLGANFYNFAPTQSVLTNTAFGTNWNGSQNTYLASQAISNGFLWNVSTLLPGTYLVRIAAFPRPLSGTSSYCDQVISIER